MTETPQKREHELAVGQLIAGRYQITSFVARGVMGSVYRAIQQPIGREVVLKVLEPRDSVLEADPRFAERFQREAETHGRLQHPNTVTLFDYGEHRFEDRTVYFMAMEFADGRTLRQVLKSERLTVFRALRLMLQICGSLQEAHSAGIVHRDLKPENIIVTDLDGAEHIKVLDFGFAKWLPQADGMQDISSLTLSGTLVGSPRYMSPEQIRSRTVDARSDVYALGCILYEMIVGQAPFRGDSPVDTCSLHLNQEVPSLSARSLAELPPGLEHTVGRCLEKDPARRLQSVGELLELLRACLIEMEMEERTSSFVVQAAPTRRTTPALLLLSALLFTGVALVAAVVGLVVLVMFEPGQSPGATSPEIAAPEEDQRWEPGLVLTVESVPPGAEVVGPKGSFGKTPIDLVFQEIPGDDTELSLSLEGYRDTTVTIAQIKAGETVELVAAPAPRSTPRPRPQPSTDPEGFQPDVRIER